MREIAFVEPIESSYICLFCRRVPGSARQLPCFHIVCDGCRERAIVDHEEQYLRNGNNSALFRLHALCPLDFTAFDETHLDVQPVSLDRVQEQLVFCLQARFGCKYKDKLRNLKRHYYYDCRFGPNSCHRYGSTEIPELDLPEPREMIEMVEDSEHL
ncbi:hypothetical protein HPB52_019192 [Rhipicephalus sanguineus]|uniref:RING-type domain-containing protein n=1 Tax=Rhipicephalus sanguineus TaxID=34632 RepID=A0A9D4PPZ0_RHISA|nr:hypothetical protein HPB52_019192 [Rhipicephalus sanguineus]